MSKTDIVAETVTINGVEYVRSDTKEPAAQVDGLDYVIVRADRAGVFAGYLESQDGDEVVMINARRLWYWSGAASLSQLAVDGTSKPNDCKFPVEVPKIKILGVIEVIPASAKAQKSLEGVARWSQ